MEKYDIPSNSIVLQTYTSNVTNSLASYLTGVLTTGKFKCYLRQFYVW